MLMSADKAHPEQNMGLIDRLLRMVIGVALIGFAYYSSAYEDVSARFWDVMGSYSMLIALYPIFTGMLGWEPIYSLLHIRSCGISGRNQCGTMPYQFKAMFGHAPKYTESETEHSLESCHDEPLEHPHHKVWRVDEEPILYPDDRAWHRYLTRNRGLRRSMK